MATLLAGGYVDLIDEAAGGAFTYGYAFDGQWGRLDHALGSASLAAQTTGAAQFHVNADEPSVLDYNVEFKTAGLQASLYAPTPYRAADHDPLVVGLALDSVPPALTLTATPTTLWPANHKLVRVQVTASATDAVDAAPAIEFVSATSSEPDDGRGDGNTTGDIVQLDAYTFLLRAERAGGGSGRVYTLTYRATDATGNSSLASVQVLVPANRGR